MSDHLSRAIARLLREEGGFVNHPKDAGGATNHGVTARALGSWRRLGRAATVEEVQALTAAEAAEFYRYRVAMPLLLHQVQQPRTVAIVLDTAVLFGADDAVPWLQESVGTKVDGYMGPNTVFCTNRGDEATTVRRIVARRLDHHLDRLAKNRSQAVFLAGWVRRANGFLHELDQVQAQAVPDEVARPVVRPG